MSNIAFNNARLIVLITIITNLADGVIKISLPILAAKLTHSPIEISSVVLCFTLPWLLTSLHVGVLVDRSDRRKLLVLANLIRVIGVATLLILYISNNMKITWLYPIAFILGIAEVIAATSETTLVPMAVKENKLQSTNTWVAGSENICNEFIGPPLGGFLLATGAWLALGFSTVAYLLAVICVLLLRGVFKIPKHQNTLTITADIRTGILFIWRNNALRTMTLLVGVMACCWSAWLAIIVLYAVSPGPMKLSESGYGLLISALGAGGLFGATVTPILNKLIGHRWVMFGDIIGTFFMLLVPALTINPYLVGLSTFCGGMGGIMWVINSRTLAQCVVPTAMLGRFYATYRLISWGFLPVGAGLAGIIAEFISLRAVFLSGAIATALLIIPFHHSFKGSMFNDLIRRK
ncbi:MFS transporter [Salmonella enterica]|uniref:MFS transporter n=1 Tax=Salmonella enterica TaxID=28901 RepID=A0A5U2FAU4_SALER|nr:MFS transporter [Salmonella enterica]